MRASEKATLIEQVRIEAKNLKKYATKSELYRLTTKGLDMKSSTSCIYGKMTGNCYGPRATKLIEKCAIRVYEQRDDTNSIDLKNMKINGSPEVVVNEFGDVTRKKDSFYGTVTYHSPIEVFGWTNETLGTEENTHKLIDYLKGKTNRLVLKIGK